MVELAATAPRGISRPYPSTLYFRLWHRPTNGAATTSTDILRTGPYDRMTRTWSKIMLAPKDTGRRLLKCSHDIKMHKRTLSSFAFNISKTSTCLKPIQFRYTIGVDHTRVSYDVQQTPSVYTLVKDCVMIITCLCHTTVHVGSFDESSSDINGDLMPDGNFKHELCLPDSHVRQRSARVRQPQAPKLRRFQVQRWCRLTVSNE
ncbi:hypothetical protein HBI03_012170 [Parastagonospora nodorum]|nr:hypothetical protein HBI03_012170 [Parastagonospora nodorum]